MINHNKEMGRGKPLPDNFQKDKGGMKRDAKKSIKPLEGIKKG